MTVWEQRAQSLTDRTPIESRGHFAKLVSPCLALTAPAGMGDDEREVWLHAAYAALRHLPAHLIEKGTKAAMGKADHPSKIVPAIIAEVAEDVKWLDRMGGRPQPEALPPPRADQVTPDEATEILRKAGLSHMALKANRPDAA